MIRTILASATCALGLVATVTPVCGEDHRGESLEVLPGDFTLIGPHAWQRLLVERRCKNRYIGQVQGEVRFESDDPQVVIVDDGIARPFGNGTATIRAVADGGETSVRVSVVAMEVPRAWSFRNHVQSVLAKAGCNSGACHGAAAGKHGFRLSLRGYDPLRDFQTITRRGRGRRVVPSDPGRSLVLLKPTGALPHGGGLRFDVGSLEYQVLVEWIASGAPPPTEADPRLERLEVLPPAVLLSPGDKQQLLVRAHFDDSRVEDVTRWSKFTSADETVAKVDDGGGVQIVGHGGGAITAWYLSRVVIAKVDVPYRQPVATDTFAAAKGGNFIDQHVLTKLEDLNVPPSPRADDATFLRRAYLDTIGLLPTIDETRQFLHDPAADKRDRLIEHLLERPEFVDYWTYKWSDLLLVNSGTLQPAAMWAYYRWIRDSVAANRPWNQFARELITASGSTLESGAANFYVLHQDPQSLAETTSIAFLGMSINCARCHNHPLEKWTNDQYYGMANLFARVRTKSAGGAGNLVVFPASSGDLVQPLSGRPQPPRPLDADPLSPADQRDRRDYLADWLTAPENAYFSRAITNRVWANFFGTGIVEPVDDMRRTNPPSNEPLLAAAAEFLAANGYDLKLLMRAILQSETYQRSSRPLPQNGADNRFFARYYPRRMMAEVLLDAISQVSDVPTKFPGYPLGWRAIELPDANVQSYFLRTFGRPERTITCECERTDEPSMVQVLHLANGDVINKKLQTKGSRAQQLAESDLSADEIIDEVYLRAFCRPAATGERERIAAVIDEAAPEARREVVEDLFWSVLTSKEFLFQH